MTRHLPVPGSILIEFRVVEYVDHEPPETFGFVHLASVPTTGDVVRLTWLNGNEAYDVRVDRVVDFTLHVRAIELRHRSADSSTARARLRNV